MRSLLLSLVCLASLAASNSRAAVLMLPARPRDGLRFISTPSLDGPRRGAWLWSFLNPWCRRPEAPPLAANLDDCLHVCAVEAYPGESTPTPECFLASQRPDLRSPAAPARAGTGAGEHRAGGSGGENNSSTAGLLALREADFYYFPTRLPRTKHPLHLTKYTNEIFHPPRSTETTLQSA